MKVKDLNGCEITVTNLDEAIRITAEYKEYEHINDRFSDLDKRLMNRYWTDMHEKLKKIKSKQSEQSRQSNRV
ncbi:hypothetical protein HIO71_08330 [Chryseobacterium aquaticum]|uniref:3-isopropylmalate dehydratase n=1 Tax=Chryseobacterium aquaticum TaxID=452084 RepID=A0A848N1I8_9FLAO|nr:MULTISPECIES: hypothetical protein [Chryseobacterium]NMR34216.1 hypothetical protein [Chryseobacterium aquaticum]NRQ46291.1 hypothetical protein [Chryseobacterium sp. C-204]